MATLAELMVKIGAETGEFSRAMKEVETTMKDTGSGLMSIGKSVGRAGSQMAQSVSLPILALGTSAIMIGASFDKQMSKVMAISGATGKEFDQLRQKALDLGSSTSFSSREVALAMEELASAGFSTDQILSSTKGVLDLAASSGIGLAEAAGIAGSALNQFGIDASESGRVADVLAKSAAISATNATQLGEAFKYVGPVASSLGLGIEEVASAIGIMADAGIQGSQAGTTLRSGLLNLASPTKEMKQIMSDLGLEFFDAKGKMKDMSGIFSELEKGTSKLTDQQKAHVLSTLFGKESVSGFMAVLKKGTKTLNTNTEALKNSSGEAGRMANQMTDNLAGAWDQLTGALESLAISFSTIMAPALREVAGFLTNLTNKFNDLSTPVKTTIVVVAGLVAALGPALAIVGFMIHGIGALIGVLGMVSLPVLAIIGVVALLGAAFMALWTQSETFKNGVITVFNAIKEKVTQAIGVVASFLKAKLDQIQQFWNENGSTILQAVTNVWNFILGVIQFIMPVIEFIVKSVWNSIKGIIDGVLNFIMGLVKVFAGLFTGDFKKMWEGIKQMFFGAVQAIWNYFNLMFIGKLIKGIGAFVKSGLSLIKDFGAKIIGFFKSTWDKGWQLVDDFCEAVVTLFKLFTARGKSNFEAFKGVVTSIWTSIKTGVVNLVKGMKDGAIAVFNGIKSTATSIFNGVKTAITKPIETAKNTVMKIIDSIKSGFSKMKITIPKPKLPKVSVAMKKGAMGIPYPDFNVSWNAKGNIFNGASILGGGQGVGEAGAEAVVPIQHKRYMKPFASAVAAHLPQEDSSKEVIVENHVHTTIELDGEVVGRKVEKYVSRQQLDRQKRAIKQSSRRL
jgi:TP901 family phage tail tape measure protein